MLNDIKYNRYITEQINVLDVKLQFRAIKNIF